MKKEINYYLNDLVIRYPKLESCIDAIEASFHILKDSYIDGGKLLIAGNGGSAADAEHIVGELMKGFVNKRELNEDMKHALTKLDPELGNSLALNLQQALPAIAVTGHTSLSTAYLNDVDGTLGFAQQVQGYGNKNDAFLGITTSGNSKNILYSSIVAKAKGMKVIALTGHDGGKVKDYADVSIIVPESETYKIQELHLPIYHTLCLMLEHYFFDN